MEHTEFQKTSLPRPKGLQLSLISSPKMSGTQIYSPVTDLAMGLGELSTSGYGNTPKRRLSLSDGTPILTLKPKLLEKQLSADAGFEDGLYSPDDASPSFLSSRFGDLLNMPCSTEKPSSAKSLFHSLALRRFNSMPVPFCDFSDSVTPEVCHSKSKLSLIPISPASPLTDSCESPSKAERRFGEEDEGSQDSGVSECSDSLSQELASSKQFATDFRFAEPLGRPPIRRVSRVLSDETNNLLFSPNSTPRPFANFRSHGSPTGSPVKLQRSSLTSCEDEDDGFLELADIDDFGSTSETPKSIVGLFTNKMVSSSDDDCIPLRHHTFKDNTCDDQENRLPSGSKSKRGLFRSPSCPRSMQRKCATFCGSLNATSLGSNGQPLCPNVRQMKRSEPECATPVHVKRRKSMIENSTTDRVPEATAARSLLQRIHSVPHSHSDVIKSAMTRRDDNDNLTGDLSRSYALPLCRSKHQDLKAISADTMSALLRGEFADSVDRAIIVDARYPYEFNGGHLQGALNLYTKDEILSNFPVSGKATVPFVTPSKHTIIIFHCEFSSERGPKMCRFLRNKDREANRDNYPALDYPEMYLLEGGYKAFFYSQDKSLCEPPTYKPMLHEAHADDLRLFRAKSKSWAGEKPGRKGARVPYRPGLKL